MGLRAFLPGELAPAPPLVQESEPQSEECLVSHIQSCAHPVPGEIEAQPHHDTIQGGRVGAQCRIGVLLVEGRAVPPVHAVHMLPEGTWSEASLE